MEQNKSVGIWVRVSTDDQAKGESPEFHEKRARLYAESKGWPVKTVYHLEGLTGKSVMGYSETKRMLSDIKSGEIAGLIFSKLGRFARNTKELLEFADIFKEEEAALISLEEAIDTSTPAGRLFYTMIAAMAQWEREEIVSRIVASIPIRAKEGRHMGGKPSLGYKWETIAGKTKELVIDEEYAPVRKLVYELFLKHKRKKTVAKTLNDQGYRTRDGKKFTDTTITRLLRDPMAKGVRIAGRTDSMGGKKNYAIRPKEEWHLHPCPAIISEELWNECNAILDKIEKKRTKVGPQTTTLLAGYVECQSCHKKMYVYHQTNNPAYTCTKCKTRIPADDLDEIYKGQLKAYLLTDTSISEYLQKLDSTLQEKQQLLFSVREERQKLKKESEAMVKMRTGGEWNKETFVEHFKPIEERIMQIDGQLPELEAEIDYLKIQHMSGDVVLSDAKDLYSRWDSLTFEEKRTIVEVITDTITVGREDIHIRLSYLPTKPTHAAEPRPIAPTKSDQNAVKRQHDV